MKEVMLLFRQPSIGSGKLSPEEFQGLANGVNLSIKDLLVLSQVDSSPNPPISTFLGEWGQSLHVRS